MWHRPPSKPALHPLPFPLEQHGQIPELRLPSGSCPSRAAADETPGLDLNFPIAHKRFAELFSPHLIKVVFFGFFFGYVLYSQQCLHRSRLCFQLLQISRGHSPISAPGTRGRWSVILFEIPVKESGVSVWLGSQTVGRCFQKPHYKCKQTRGFFALRNLPGDAGESNKNPDR